MQRRRLSQEQSCFRALKSDLSGSKLSTDQAPKGIKPYLKICKSHHVSLVSISALSNFSVVSVGFNLPAWQIASNPGTVFQNWRGFSIIFLGFFFFFPGNAAEKFDMFYWGR